MSAKPHFRIDPPHTQVPSPIFVDLDGTLLRTDMLWESAVAGIRRRPAIVSQLAAWALRGPQVLKERLAAESNLSVKSLPVRPEVVDWVQSQRAIGRPIVLATAATHEHAEQVASQFGCFDDVLASDSVTNLKGEKKLNAIKAWCQKHGYDRFAYVGDSDADIPIWNQCDEPHIVGPNALRLAGLVSHRNPTVIPTTQELGRSIIRAMRPQQWVKNLLLFVPLLLAGQMGLAYFGPALVGIIAFSLCASAIYVLNDMLDVESDREHPVKCRRPFASGQLPLSFGPMLCLGLLTAGMTLALAVLPYGFAGILTAYVAMNLAYSTQLKKETLLDVMLLAGLYTMRILAGGQASGVYISEWLLAFSGFLFMSLAFVKRYAELVRLKDLQRDKPSGRGYLVADIPLLEAMGTACSFSAVIVLALYVSSDAAHRTFARTWPIWLLCPTILFWTSRLWLLAHRRVSIEDPVAFAIRDRVSLGVAAISGILWAIASI